MAHAVDMPGDDVTTEAIARAAGLDRSYVYRLLRKHGYRNAR